MSARRPRWRFSTAAQLGSAVPNGDPAALLAASALLTLMVGVVLIVASVLRLGFIANFISEPVLVGFKAGIAIVILVDQLPKILGIHFAKGSFLHNLQQIALGVSHLSVATLVLGALTIAGLAAIEKLPTAMACAVDRRGIGHSRCCVARCGLARGGTGRRDSAGLPPLTLPNPDLWQELWRARSASH